LQGSWDLAALRRSNANCVDPVRCFSGPLSRQFCYVPPPADLTAIPTDSYRATEKKCFHELFRVPATLKGGSFVVMALLIAPRLCRGGPVSNSEIDDNQGKQ
jgi:hypothetical protein